MIAITCATLPFHTTDTHILLSYDVINDFVLMYRDGQEHHHSFALVRIAATVPATLFHHPFLCLLPWHWRSVYLLYYPHSQLPPPCKLHKLQPVLSSPVLALCQLDFYALFLSPSGPHVSFFYLLCLSPGVSVSIPDFRASSCAPYVLLTH